MHVVNANLVLYYKGVKTEENAITITLRRKLKVKIPLEVENCNNSAEEKHLEDTSSGRRCQGQDSPHFPSCSQQAKRSQMQNLPAIDLRFEGEYFLVL